MPEYKVRLEDNRDVMRNITVLIRLGLVLGLFAGGCIPYNSEEQQAICSSLDGDPNSPMIVFHDDSQGGQCTGAVNIEEVVGYSQGSSDSLTLTLRYNDIRLVDSCCAYRVIEAIKRRSATTK